ncbi:MAG: electron transfer flavoprotein subunit alpha/FixB family protein [Thermomicrobiales bacterium]
MPSGTLIVAETHEGALRGASLELISAALGLGSSVTALVLGSGIGTAADEMARTGVSDVLAVDSERLSAFTTDAYSAAVEAAIKNVDPSVVLFAGTTSGRDLAPRIAARFGAPLAANAVELKLDGGALIASRPVLGGRVQSDVRLEASLVVASIGPGAFEKAATTSSAATVESLEVDFSAVPERVRVTGVGTVDTAGGATLANADVIVAGGRGLKESANFALVEALASQLGGAVAASRAVVDAGWRPHQEQIGQTGKTVAPKLYIAVGISGAVQHNVGMQGSDHIIAINRDPDAPIFKLASFGIVGDLFEIVPELTRQLAAAE